MSKFDDDLDRYEEFEYLENLTEKDIIKDKEEKEKIAVALRFDPEKDTAPRIVAAGRGVDAEQIIELAEESDVPVYKQGELAEDLSQFEVGAIIPGALYELIAEMLIFLYHLDESWLEDRMENFEEQDEDESDDDYEEFMNI